MKIPGAGLAARPAAATGPRAARRARARPAPRARPCRRPRAASRRAARGAGGRRVAPDDHVGGAGFVFERDEDHAARGVGPLPADDDAGGADDAAVRRLRRSRPPWRAAARCSWPRSSASGCRRSVSDERPVVGDDVLAFGRRRQRGIGFVERAAREQRRQPLDAGDVPRRAVAMAGERRERVGLGEAGEVAAVEPRAVREIGDARERLRPPRVDDPLRAGFRQSGDQAQAEAQRGEWGQIDFSRPRIRAESSLTPLSPACSPTRSPSRRPAAPRRRAGARPARAATARRSPSAAS